MAENRYRRSSPPPGSRHYYAPRSSGTMVFASSFDHANYSRGNLELQAPSRRTNVYEAQPTKRYSYHDGARGPVSAIHYAMRPRTNSAVQPESRPHLSLLDQSGPPTRNHSVASNPVRSDHRGSLVIPSTPRYLVPAVSHGREHQRHYSATRAEIERTASLTRSAAGGVRPRSEYHHAGGYNSTEYSSSRVKDDDFSYTGPREQFARDYPSRPPDRRDSLVRRERPVSVYEIAGYKDSSSIARRDTAPPSPVSRQVDRVDRGNVGRANGRLVYESDPDRVSGPVPRRHSIRSPVVHQILEDDQRDYARHDGYESRPRPRRDTIEEGHPTRQRVERVPAEDLQPRSRKDRDEDLPVRYKKDRFEDDGPRKERYPDDEPSPRPRREHVTEADLSPKPRLERGAVRDRLREREREYDKDRDRVRDYERSRDSDRLRPVERSQKRSDDRRGSRSRDNSPVSGHSKALATGLGSLAAAGIAGTALKSSPKAEEISDGDSRKEKKTRKHRHHDDDGDRARREQRSGSDRKTSIDADERLEERKRGSRRDDSASESPDDGREHHRRQGKHRDREQADLEPAPQARGGPDSDGRDASPLEEEVDHSRRRRRASRAHEEEDTADLERRTLSPGDDEDGRPRRVQLVEPLKEKEEFKPKGILKAPRTVPFPEDPNPTREGVAPLKDAGKEGVPPNARWTKISRVLVNPEALEKAQERFEEREDYVIVLRVLSKDEIQKLAEKTQEIRANREKEWQEELERQRTRKGIEDKEVEEKTIPLLDQVPANPSVDSRTLTNTDQMPTAAAASVAPVSDIKLDNVAAGNHSLNV